MASTIKLTLILSVLLHGASAEVICKDLPASLCSFAIASSGKRCVLENYVNEEGSLDYTCKSSEVLAAERFAGSVETDGCVSACGVDRSSVGISSDAFLTPEFASSLCSSDCFQNCPNIIDLYFNLAAGEGVFLPAFCAKQRSNPHRAMFQLLSGGATGNDASVAPSPSPAAF